MAAEQAKKTGVCFGRDTAQNLSFFLLFLSSFPLLSSLLLLAPSVTTTTASASLVPLRDKIMKSLLSQLEPGRSPRCIPKIYLFYLSSSYLSISFFVSSSHLSLLFCSSFFFFPSNTCATLRGCAYVSSSGREQEEYRSQENSKKGGWWWCNISQICSDTLSPFFAKKGGKFNRTV